MPNESGLNDVGRDRAAAYAHNAKWAAAEDERDRALEREEQWVETVIARCINCRRAEYEICEHHARMFNLPLT